MAERTVRGLYHERIENIIEHHYKEDTSWKERRKHKNDTHLVFLGKDLAQRFCQEEGIDLIELVPSDPHIDANVRVAYTIPKRAGNVDLFLVIHSHFEVGYGRIHPPLAPFFKDN